MYVILAATALQASGIFPTVNSAQAIQLTVWITGFLCVLNIGLAVFFRKRRLGEVVSYYAAFGFEFVVFILALLLAIKVIAQVPFHLPPGLPISSPEIAAALAFGIGLFPAAYWHRVNISDLPKRIAEDAKTMKDRDGGVHIRKSAPGEWMN